MNTKTIFLSLFMALALLAAFWMVLERRGDHGDAIISGKTEIRISPSPHFDREAIKHEPEEISVNSERVLPLGKPPQPLLAMPSPKRANSPPLSIVEQPQQPVQGESVSEPSVPQPSLPKTPAVVLPPEEISPAKLCGGEQISECVDCGFTHLDFALLILDILGVKRVDATERAFETLETLDIEPGGGWAKSNPEQPMTPEEMEEVRCSISLAAEDGSIPVEPAAVTTAMNRFCGELGVSVKAMRDSGVAKGGHTGGGPIPPAETGYQGGTDGVVSSAF